MAKVKMLLATRHAGNPYGVGQVVDVPDNIAEHWKARGIAADPRAKDPETGEGPDLQEQVRRQNLRIAALHGDVAAAREMERLGMPAEEAQAFGTPPPLELTNDGAPAATTGESARGALAGAPAAETTNEGAPEPVKKPRTAKQEAATQRLREANAAKARAKAEAK